MRPERPAGISRQAVGVTKKINAALYGTLNSSINKICFYGTENNGRYDGSDDGP